MDETPIADRDQITRWAQEGQQILGVLPGLLEQVEQNRARATDVEQEMERLRHDVAEMRRENQQLRAERDEMAEALNKLMTDVVAPMNEFASKIKVTPRRSPFERDPRAPATPSAPTQAPTPSS